MDLDTLAKLGEFVGGFFVVASLAYLAHQARQTTRSLQTENYSRVLERMSTVQARLSTDAELNRIVVIGAQDPSALTSSERLRFSWALYELLGAGEFMYHQAMGNALPPAVWDRWTAGMAWWLSHPGIEAWWRAKPAPLSADFEAFVDDLVSRQVVAPGGFRPWERFVGHGAACDASRQAADSTP